MIYPAIIFIVIAIVVVVMMVYMIPAVKDLYSDFGLSDDDLPGVTSALVSMSNFMTSVESLLFVPITPDGPRLAQPTTYVFVFSIRPS